MDKNNRFMQILIAAQALRKTRHQERSAHMEEHEPHPGKKINYVPDSDRSIPYERKEYLHKIVKEILNESG